MSYQLYINGKQIEIRPLSLAQTKQVNDIANLSKRNSNFTSSIKVPITAQNTRELEKVGLVGNQSNLPYRRNVCDLINEDTGEHLVYKGWAALIDTTEEDYIFTVYDGVIDFYKAIENITITQCGISDLNHIKSLSNIIDSWTDLNKPYRYIVADYNGNNEIDGKLNIDYQVPSASTPYLWNRIFDYIGFTYSGSVFQHEKFINHWLTFPKPTGEVEPNEVLINNQTSSDQPYLSYSNSGTAILAQTFYNIDIFREDFDDPRAVLENTGQYTNVTSPVPHSVPVQSYIRILQTGVYSFKMVSSGILDFRLTVKNSLDEIIILTQPFTDSVIFNANEGDKVFVSSGVIPAIGLNDLSIDFNYIDGYAVNFDDIFIDFKVSDFINEIVIRFGLTPFTNKYNNNVEFLTTSEILQNAIIDDSWRKKYIRKILEKHTFGDYAKKNMFTYKYNDEGEKHNDGSLSIANENLAEEITLFQSQIYSPEDRKTFLLGKFGNVYPIWQKEIKDDGSIGYKDLKGRFYFQRAELLNLNINMVSAITSDEATNAFYFRESYFRLSFREIINDWYKPLGAIFNKAKLITIEANLKAIDLVELDFRKLIYIPQLASYFILNKVINYVKNKPVKIELIEVDYLSELEPDIPIITQPTITINTLTLEGCEITLGVTTDLVQPTEVEIVPFTLQQTVSGNFGWSEIVMNPPILATLTGNSVTFSISQLEYLLLGYKFMIRKSIAFNEPVVSNLSELIVLDGSCFVPYPSNGTYIAITNIQTLSINGFNRTIRIFFTSDFVGVWNFTAFFFNDIGNFFQVTSFSTSSGGSIDMDIQYAPNGDPLFPSKARITSGSINSNLYNYVP